MSCLDERPARYRHVMELVAERPWAIQPGTLAVIIDLLSYRAHGHRLTDAEVAERIEAGVARSAARRGAASGGGAVAVLPLYGIIGPRAAAFDAVSSPGGTGIDAFTQMFRRAVADPSVGSILIEVDSPGGRVDQVPELAAEIRGARGQKPIVAIANTTAASAAYWIACQCDELVVTPSGEVGSIGVYSAHQDLSGMYEQDGVKVTLISAGKFKTEGNPFGPPSEEALQAFQADVDAFYGMFVADVAKGRSVSADDVRSGFGEGRMVMARDAVKAGMADRVATFDDTVARLARGDVPAGRNAHAATVDVVIRADTSEFEASLHRALVASHMAALAKLGVTVEEAEAMTDAELLALAALEPEAPPAPAPAHDPEGGLPSTLATVAGAEQLLRHAAVREAFTPGPTD